MPSDARFHSLFHTTPDLVLIMDDAGLVVAANPSVQRILGHDPEKLVGSPLSAIMPERYRKAHDEGFKRYLATGVRKLDWKSIELPGLAADGREVPLSISFGEYEEGGRRFFTGILRDVSAEKARSDTLAFLAQVGPELASSRLDYHTTLRKLAQLAVPGLADWSAVDIVGDDGKVSRLAVAHADPAKVALATEVGERYPTDPDASFGVPQVVRSGKAEVLADIPEELLRSAAKDEHHLELIRSLGLRSYVIVPIRAHGRTYGALSLVQAESGRRFTEADVPLIEELGRRAGLAVHDAGLYRDALETNQLLEEQASELEQQTEEAQALAEEMESQTEELLKTVDQLRLKTEEAAAANAAKSAFLASMSHELRTPLNAIAGYVELISMGLRGPVTEEQRADLERIRLAQLHLLGLINDVLNFAKVEAGRLEYHFARIALDEVLKDCEGMILPQIHARRISYTYEECGESVFVKADRDRVQQVILNLLGNATKFTREGGRISAACDKVGGYGRVLVRDTGIGIEADKLDSVFEPFVQIDRTLNQPGQGAGLGLAISRALARDMGGDIVVESEPGVGSTFVFTLPLWDEEGPDGNEA
jgi:PAS domain S-box-containing protein